MNSRILQIKGCAHSLLYRGLRNFKLYKSYDAMFAWIRPVIIEAHEGNVDGIIGSSLDLIKRLELK